VTDSLFKWSDGLPVGGGDMKKSVYDTDDDGKVDAAEEADHAAEADHATTADSATTADAAESVPWSGVTGKPTTFPPSSHTHSSTYTALTLQNGWENYGGGYGKASYFKDISGVVHLSGLVRSGTAGARITVLPEGYRPANALVFRNYTQYGAGRLNVSSDGSVKPEADAQSGWISLDGISFLAEAEEEE